MAVSVRQQAKEIIKSLGYTKVTLSTVQKRFGKFIEPGKQFKDLSEKEQKAVYSQVEQSVLVTHRRHRRSQQDAMDSIHMQLSNKYKISPGGVKARFVRMLKSEGGDWDQMGDSEREAFEACVLKAIDKSQSSGVGSEKECYLDGVKVGPALELHKKLQAELKQPLLSQQFFTKQLIAKFSCKGNVRRVELKKEDAVEYLTKAGYAKNNPRKINELATPSRLRAILEGLLADGFVVKFDGVKTCYDRIIAAKGKKWKELNVLEQDEMMEAVDAKLRDEGNERYRKAEWVLEVDGKERTFNGAELHRFAQQIIEDDCLSRQPFLNRLKAQQVSNDNSIVDGKRIVDWPAFLETVFEVQKKLPATIYKIVFIAGKYAGYEYVGATQCLLGERLSWHGIDAKRKKHANSERPMHLAMRDALEYEDISSVLEIEPLEENVPITQLEERETMYIEQIWGGKCLNSHKKGGSIGGRGSLRQVQYKGESYALAEACRVAAKDYVLGDGALRFIKRVRGFFYGTAASFDEAVEFAVAGESGRKRRSDLLDYNVAGERMTFEDIQKSDKYPEMDNVQKIRSKVLRNHPHLTRLSETGNDIESILLDEIKPDS
jgi:hypothetical protein